MMGILTRKDPSVRDRCEESKNACKAVIEAAFAAVAHGTIFHQQRKLFGKLAKNLLNLLEDISDVEESEHQRTQNTAACVQTVCVPASIEE
jgi:hypothetical protein